MAENHSVTCPECGHEFKLSDAGYADIAAQVRTAEFERELSRAVSQEREVNAARQDAMRTQFQLELAQAREGDQRRIRELELQVASDASQHEREIRGMREQHAFEMGAKDAEIERYRDFKLRMSTKMVGESLERYCEDAFNKLRATAFRGAYFEKDNDASSGSKGDYVFRDAKDGVEYVSIMFEMKNEMDDTEKKHKNEDFFAKLDRDRREKGCEYAVLVSMLEADSELYNSGIVDVSWRYPKMYVVRPQFFIPILTILRNASMDSLWYREELERERMRSIDVSRFEDELDEFKERFSKNRDLSERKVGEAVDEIDKAISRLQKAKDALVSAERNMRLAGDKLDGLTVRRLTRDNPTMAQMFERPFGE